MVGNKQIVPDEIRHQIGNSLFALALAYSQYDKHPENVKRLMSIMLHEAKRLVEKLQKICENEHI